MDNPVQVSEANAARGIKKTKIISMNKDITPGVAGVVIGAGLNELIRKKVEKHDATLDSNHFSVRAVKALLFSGILIIFMFGALGIPIITELFRNPFGDLKTTMLILGVAILNYSFVFLGIKTILNAVVRHIQINGNQIIYTSPFGKKEHFTFNDITKVEMLIDHSTNQKLRYRVYVGYRKVFTVRFNYKGYHALFSRLKNEHIPIEEIKAWL
jgi:hypothetical protein